jgi:hypothetical protein
VYDKGGIDRGVIFLIYIYKGATTIFTPLHSHFILFILYFISLSPWSLLVSKRMSTNRSSGLWLLPHSLSQTSELLHTLSKTKLNNPFSSPMFTYTTDDWSTGYAAQPNGYDQTLHMASASASRVSFNLAGTFMSFGCDFRILTLQPLPLLSSSPLSRTVPPSYRSIPQTQFQHAQRDQPRHLPIFHFHSIRFLWAPTRFTGM